jgi:hypothetical protein
MPTKTMFIDKEIYIIKFESSRPINNHFAKRKSKSLPIVFIKNFHISDFKMKLTTKNTLTRILKVG